LGAILVHFTRFAAVSFLVESHEEKEILNASKGEHEGGGNWIITLEDEGLESMKEDEDKLNKLEGCEVLLPPEILLNLRPTSSQQVVEVHDRVDAGVEEWSKSTLSTSHKSWTPPTQPRQSAMVDDMKGGEMTKLFTSNKEEGVKQVNKLGEEIPPSQVESSHGRGALGVVYGLTVPVVTPGDIEPPPLHEHPRAEDGLEQVVGKHDALDLVRLTILHEPWSPDLDYVDIEYAYSCGDPDGGHQGPGVNTGVTKIHHKVRIPFQNTRKHPTPPLSMLNTITLHPIQSLHYWEVKSIRLLEDN